MIKSLGSDPEVFILDDKGNPISSEGLVGGTKDEPRDLGDGILIQEDNVALEFNIPPCETKQDFVSNLKLGLVKAQEQLDKYGYKVHIKASEVFDPCYIYTPHGLTMGCEPDINVYTGKDNEPANPDTCLRSCGGHIHVGLDFKSVSNNRRQHTINYMVRAMDLFLTVPSMILDTDTQRRTLYGKAGSYRKKKYGFEFRPLSNFWIGSDELIKWVWHTVHFCYKFIQEEANLDSLVHDEHLILKSINENNLEITHMLCEKYGIEIPQVEVKKEETTKVEI